MEKTKPKLERRVEFEELLKDYRPSDEAIGLLNNMQTLILVAPTGAGKNTLIKRLVETGRFFNVLSDTTRPPRMHGDRLEENGEYYWHISEGKFLEGLRERSYIEAAIIHEQQVSGSNSAEYKKAHDAGKIAVTDIEAIYGVPVLRGYSEKPRFIFLVPPGFDEWMRRLEDRGKMTESEMRNRLESAEEEIASALERPYYYFMVSRDLEQNVQSAIKIIDHGSDPDIQEVSRQQAVSLLEEIRDHLN